MSFGLNNAVPSFQWTMDDLIKSTNCEGTNAYLGNITVGGRTQEEHDRNLNKLLEATRNSNFKKRREQKIFSIWICLCQHCFLRAQIAFVYLTLHQLFHCAKSTIVKTLARVNLH